MSFLVLAFVSGTSSLSAHSSGIEVVRTPTAIPRAAVGLIRRHDVIPAIEGGGDLEVTQVAYGTGAEGRLDRPGEGVCYIRSGTFVLDVDDARVLALPGNFLRSPLGAAPKAVRALRAGTMICVYTGATGKDAAAPTATADIDGGSRPQVRYHEWRDVASIVSPAGAKATSRRIISARDGAVRVEVTRNAYEAGLDAGPIPSRNHGLCWIETGRIEMVSGGRSLRIGAGDFVRMPAGAVIDRIRVRRDSVSICWSVPAYPPGTAVQP